MDDKHEDIIRKLAERKNSELPEDSSEEHQSYKHILDTAENWETPENKIKDEIWESLEGKLDLTDANGVNPKIRKRITWLRVGIAAVLLIAASFGYRFLRGDEIKFNTGAGEVATFYLPDSSKVVLNSSSEISFRSKKYRKRRQLKLNGEAYFDVEKGTDFTVESNGILTSVLGTTFNIYSRATTTSVQCLTGRVGVKVGVDKVELKQGEMIQARERELKIGKTNFDTSKALSWMNGKFYYDKSELMMVIKEIEIQFGVDVEGRGFEERVYTGYFDTTSLEKALNQVFIPMGYSYTISENIVSVR